MPDEELESSMAIEEMLAEMVSTMPIREPSDFMFGVNLVRVIANDTNLGSPAPGLHQDGYAFSLHLNVSRENVSGGASIIATGPDVEDIVVEHELTPGEFVVFNDKKMFHTATPVAPRICGKPKWRDVAIIDVVEK